MTSCAFKWNSLRSYIASRRENFPLYPLTLSFPPLMSFRRIMSFRAKREIFPSVQAERKISPHYVRRNDKLCVQVEFAQVLHCIAARKLSPLPLNPVISAPHVIPTDHVISSAARNLSLFSLPPPFPPQRVGSGARGPCRSHSRMLAVPCPCSREPRGCPRQFWRACPGRSPVPGLPAAPWIGVHPPPRPRGRGLTFHAIPATIAVRRHVESGRVLPGRRNTWVKVASRPGRR